jgi:hypothetical protein
MTTYLYNKQQMLHIISAWGVDAQLPTKGNKTVVQWPAQAVLDMAEITVDDKKTTYGKTMYKVVLTSKFDRENKQPKETHENKTTSPQGV